MFLAFRADGAKDWATNLLISPKLAGQADKVEFHHVFPKAFMKKARPDIEGRDVDDIANLAFIGSKTNKDISAKAPAAYAGTYSKDQLARQLVVFDDHNSVPEAFEKFVEQRRALIAERLNEFLDVTSTS